MRYPLCKCYRTLPRQGLGPRGGEGVLSRPGQALAQSAQKRHRRPPLPSPTPPARATPARQAFGTWRPAAMLLPCADKRCAPRQSPVTIHTREICDSVIRSLPPLGPRDAVADAAASVRPSGRRAPPRNAPSTAITRHHPRQAVTPRHSFWPALFAPRSCQPTLRPRHTLRTGGRMQTQTPVRRDQ